MGKIIVDRKSLNHYKIKLTTLTPVHVGTGEYYEPTSFVIDDHFLYEFDEIEFYNRLKDEDKKTLEDKFDNWLDVIKFYKQKRDIGKEICVKKYKVSSEVEKKYDDDTPHQFMIAKTYKNLNTYEPIIPGSSIKGMLNTLLDIYSKPEKASNAKRQNLIVSDTSFVRGEVEIGIAYRRHRKPDKETKGNLHQIIEVISPQSEFVFTVDCDFTFDFLIEYASRYHAQRKNSRFESDSVCMVLRVGKNVGKEYVVYDGRNVKNSYNKSLATHFLYSSNDLTDEEFGWVKLELMEQQIVTKSDIKPSHNITAPLLSLKNRLKKQLEGSGIKMIIKADSKFADKLSIDESQMKNILKKLDISVQDNEELSIEDSIRVIDATLDFLKEAPITDKKVKYCRTKDDS